MSVRTELTWEKEPEGHTPENSIKAILFGEEIASGYIGLFTTASTQGMNESQLIAGVKASGKVLTTAQLERLTAQVTLRSIRVCRQVQVTPCWYTPTTVTTANCSP